MIHHNSMSACANSCLCKTDIQVMCAALCCCFNLQIELQFGPVYDKYRYSCYYWECVVLIEAFLLALMLVMLQTLNSPALQVLVAMAIIFIEAVLHVSVKNQSWRARLVAWPGQLCDAMHHA